MNKMILPQPLRRLANPTNNNSSWQLRLRLNVKCIFPRARVLDRQQQKKDVAAKGSEADSGKNHQNDSTKGTKEPERITHPQNIDGSLTSNGLKDNSDDEVYDDDTDIDEVSV